jgi:hypothetical protein
VTSTVTSIPITCVITAGAYTGATIISTTNGAAVLLAPSIPYGVASKTVSITASQAGATSLTQSVTLTALASSTLTIAINTMSSTATPSVTFSVSPHGGRLLASSPPKFTISAFANGVTTSSIIPNYISGDIITNPYQTGITSTNYYSLPGNLVAGTFVTITVAISFMAGTGSLPIPQMAATNTVAFTVL